MSDLSDYDLDTGGHEPPRPASGSTRPPRTWIVVAVVIVAIGAGAYLWLTRRTPDTTTTGTTATSAPAPSDRRLGGDAEPITVPPLDESDPLVRKLVAALSSHPRVAAWLATNGLIRNFAVVVENISTGTTPARHLRVLRPSRPFRASEADGEERVDPRSYERYSSIAEAVASIDAAGAAKLYATLKPRIEEAYAELGRQEPFDRALERAIVALLQTPVVEGNVRLEPTGATQYRYADPRLERLTGAQKQFLRMGPRNMRVIQGKLREMAMALGIAAERLPPVGRT